MRFIKYQLVLEDMNEDSFEEKLGDDGFWNEIESEQKKYGLEGFGVNKRGNVVVMGEILQSNASLCSGLLSELKTWLKSKYKSKVTETMIARGSFPFARR